jgi:CheY-like chemotaxis protein
LGVQELFKSSRPRAGRGVNWATTSKLNSMTFEPEPSVTPLGHVLIVEDDPDTREMLATLLTSEGFHVVGAEDGLEALHLLRAVRHAGSNAPCLVLLDLNMPRFSGNEFRRAQLGDPVVSPVPIVVMSGAADVDEWARALGAVATLNKPIDFDLLIQVVRRYCTGASAPFSPSM